MNRIIFILIYIVTFLPLIQPPLKADSLSHYDRAIHIDSNDPDAYFSRGYALFRKGEYKKALKDFDQALKLAPNESLTYFFRGRTKAELKLHYQAIQDFDTAIKLNSKNLKAFLHRAQCRGEMGEISGALEDYNSALQISPSRDDIFILKGMLELRLCKYKKAITSFEKAKKLNPQNQDSLEQLSILYTRCPDESLRKYDQGLQCAKELIGLSALPKNLSILANAYAEIKNFDQAIKYQNQAFLKTQSEEDKKLLDLFLAHQSLGTIEQEKRDEKEKEKRKAILERQRKEQIWQDIVNKNKKAKKKKNKQKKKLSEEDDI